MAIVMPNTADERVLIAGIMLRSHYAGFARRKVTDNEKAATGLGFTIAFQGANRGEATVYIYRKGLTEIPDGPMDQAIRQEFDHACQEVCLYPQIVPGARVDLDSRYGTGAPDRGHEFLCAEFILADSNGSRRSFVYLTGASGNFVKIRITLMTNDATDPTARNFADAVASDLWKR